MSYSVLNNTPVPHKVDSIYENRLRQFTDEGEYRNVSLPKFYDKARIDNQSPKNDSDGFIKSEVYSVPGLDRPLFKEAIKNATWRDTHKGESFGPSWSTHWFRIHVKIPDSWSKEKQILLNWDCNNEGLIFTKTGLALQAFTGGNERSEWIVPEEWRDGDVHQFYIETSCNGMFGNANGSTIQPPDPNRYFTLSKADLVVPNLEARALHIDFWMLGDAAREFPGNTWQKHKARQVATDIMDAFDPNDVESVAKCREIAKTYIGSEIDSDKVYDSKRAINQPIEVYALGNCHIDTAWLWPFAETRRKIGRSWVTQLDLIERYPEYQFVTSQAQQYKWLQQDYPDIFERVKQQVQTGRFIPVGGSWVENDTNMPSGESISRQFLLGQRFFEHYFGKKSDIFWLPDTFGYSAQIPQLCRLAGMDKFLTQKLSWNNINKFPNTTFNWVALDGSQVLCHMPPCDTYTASAHFGDVSRSLHNHKNLAEDQTGLMVFGHGDGGGGPTPEMLEKLRRLRGISNTVGLLPTVELKTNVDEFYNNILKNSNNGEKLVSWIGELYFEFHRGTYTTQANTKKGNRVSEVLIHDLEFLATLASISSSTSTSTSTSSKKYKYPKKEIDALWEDICLCQFHDVLPGSCIEMVYDDAKKIYAHLHDRLSTLIDDALINLGLLKPSSIEFSDPNKKKLIASCVNTYPWPRSDILEIQPEQDFINESKFKIQNTKNGKKLIHVSSKSSGIMKTSNSSFKGNALVSKIDDKTFVLQNGKLKATIIGGLVTSLYDLINDREVFVKSGKTKGGNQFVLFEDQPLSWQAWDTEVYSLEKYKLIEQGDISIYEDGPLRASVIVNQKISDVSSIKTIISLKASQEGSLDDDSSYLEFTTEVIWHESCKFLKVEFPVDIHNDYALYECQFGAVRRPTHYNTSWDVAKFEVCSHKWADYSDYSYGVTVLNNCKYGFSTHGNIMRLSLLRSPKAPDANADMGTHTFKYAVLPHKNGITPSIIKTAHNFNHPLHVVYTKPSETIEEEDDDDDDEGFNPVSKFDVLNWVSIKGDDNLILSNIKRAEDDFEFSTLEEIKSSNPGIIVRVYEPLGGRASGSLVIDQTHGLPKISKVTKVNILEDDLETLEFYVDIEEKGKDNIIIPITLRAFEVATYKLLIE